MGLGRKSIDETIEEEYTLPAVPEARTLGQVRPPRSSSANGTLPETALVSAGHSRARGYGCISPLNLIIGCMLAYLRLTI